MDELPSRRRLLQGVGVSILGVATGCVAARTEGSTPSTETTGRGSNGSGGCSRPPESKTARTTTTTTSRTYTGTSGPDERVDRRPPVAPALPASGEWPENRYDAGNRACNPDASAVRDGDRYWRVAGGSTPVVADGRMVNVFGRDREERALARRDPTTAGPCSTTPLVSYGVSTPPVIAGDRAFVTTFIEVFCCATDRDAVLWRGPEMDGIQAPPAVSDDAVYVNSGGFQGVSPHLRAFGADGGDQLWRYDTGSESKSAPALADGAVFVVATDGLHGVDAETGERRFLAPEAGERWTTPVATDRAVYVAVHGETQDELLAVDPADGTIRWRTATTMGNHPPVVAAEDREVYAVVDEELVALDAADGTRLRSFEESGRPLARGGDVVYAARGGRLDAFDVDGTLLWEYATEEVTISDTIGQRIYGVTPVDDAVYVSARDAFHGIGPRRE